MEIRYLRAAAFAAALGILTQIACAYVVYWHGSYDVPADGMPVWWNVVGSPLGAFHQMLAPFVAALVVPKHKWFCGALIGAVARPFVYQVFWSEFGYPFVSPPPFPFNERLAGGLLAGGIYGAFAGAAAAAVSPYLSLSRLFKPNPLRDSA